MTDPRSWPSALNRRLGAVGDRLGQRGIAGIVLAFLLLLGVVPLVAMPAVRCEVFGSGCRKPAPEVRADPVAKQEGRALTPVEVATRGAYVALGDSYSSGVGAEASLSDQNPLERCHRTSKAYYHAVSKAFPFAGGSSFWACSGATTEDVRKGKDGEPPQLGRLNAGTSLVTISIGGNDVGFSKILTGCVVKLPWSKSCEEQGRDIAGRMATLRQTLPALVDEIVDRAPRARVIMMGYPRAFSEVDGADGDNITLQDQRFLNARAHELGELIRQTAAEADARIVSERGLGSVEFVDAYSAFAGHEVGSSDPYMNGLGVSLSALSAEPRSFHPTVKGHEALTRLFVDQIKKGPGRSLAQPA
ncbi:MULTISPECIES: SGNH/GDSL hydrolase family protein [Actinomadura]|uniref:SGNH/GDSL hydrolase family protein n=2 Tax=Actinomadura yumaensis TaxID=111807 RepID=A0ABW2CZQ6_9ACTN|nr:SGNH/GDSL hydrolase family protein [Actinomadura sp. J1-007]MWK37986.1 SGNH/GDSL hydrolase family protein [Actinomadura sp. J1-007]